MIMTLVKYHKNLHFNKELCREPDEGKLSCPDLKTGVGYK